MAEYCHLSLSQTEQRKPSAEIGAFCDRGAGRSANSSTRKTKKRYPQIAFLCVIVTFGSLIFAARFANSRLHHFRVTLNGQDDSALFDTIRAAGDDRQDLPAVGHAQSRGK